MLSTFATMLYGPNGLASLIQAVAGAKTDAEFAATKLELLRVIGDIQQQLHVAQTSYTAALRDKDDFEQKYLRVSDWLQERELYELHKLPTGISVYRRKSFSDGPADAYYLCRHCYENCVKAILQPTAPSFLGKMMKCHNCDSFYQVECLRVGVPDKDYDWNG